MSGIDNTQPSTVKSYIDSGVAAVQNAVGSLTGEFYPHIISSNIISLLHRSFMSSLKVPC